MILVIRGHIRNSFDNLNLFNLVKFIYNIDNNLKIYIHTWNIVANNISWRNIEVNDNIVTEETIYEYFGELKSLIKCILIDDDKNIKLIGNIEGKINKGVMPLIGWKNYWYGKYKIIDHIYKTYIDANELVINLRFDILKNSNNFTNIEISNFIEKNIKTKFTKNNFLRDNEFLGVDNIYIGNIYTMHKLIHHFFYFLDDILQTYNNTTHQELIVFRVNNIYERR